MFCEVPLAELIADVDDESPATYGGVSAQPSNNTAESRREMPKTFSLFIAQSPNLSKSSLTPRLNKGQVQ